MCAGVKPTRNTLTIYKCYSFPRQVSENDLGYVLSEMRIAVHLPQRSGIDQIQVPLHDFSEGFFRLPLDVAPDQFTIEHHSVSIAPATAKTARRIISPQELRGNLRFG